MKNSLLCIFLFMISIKVISLPPTNELQKIPLNQGITKTNCITQDTLGFIWLATLDGLFKYDGRQMQKFIPEHLNPQSIIHRDIRSVFTDNEGQLWIGTRNGLCTYNTANESFERINLSPKTQDDINVQIITQDNEETIWLGTNFGLYRVNPVTKVVKHFLHTTLQGMPSLQLQINAIVSINSQSLWIGTSIGLLRFNKKSGTFDILPQANGSKFCLAQKPINALHLDKSGYLWVGTDAGLSRSLKQADEFPLEFSCIRNKIPGEDPEKTNHITAISGTKNGWLWIGSYGGGVLQYNPKTNQFQQVEFEIGNTQMPTNKFINKIFIDKAGIVWVASEDGAYKYNTNPSLFVSHQFNPYSSAKEPFIYVNNLLEDETGRIWLAGMGMGVVCLDEEKQQSTLFKQKAAPQHKLISDNIRCIARDKSGTMYIGTFTQGVQQIKLNSKNQIIETRHLTHQPNNNNSLPSNTVRSIHIDKKGIVWFATPEGLTKYMPSSNTYKHYKHQPNNSHSLSNNFISCIFEENDNTLWLGTRGGVNILDKTTEKFTHIKHQPADTNSLASNHVLSITKSNNNTYWLGTFGGGLSAYNAQTGSIKTFTTANGLPSDIIYGCMEDASGNLWISTSNGISHFNPASNTFKNYGLEDGLQSLDFNTNSYLKTRNGKMYFGGTYGFNQVHPDSLLANTREVPLVLTDLKILNKHIRVGEKVEKRTLLQKSFNYTDTLTLSFHNQSFSIQFAALDFANPERVKYSYKIENRNNEWIDLGSENQITFHSLPPGHYTLWINASSDQIHVSTPLKLYVHILPPWWQEWWFLAIASLMFLTIIYALYAVRVAILRIRQKELETIVTARTSELTSVNQILEEQAEELNSQHEQLYEVNQLLEEQYEEIEQQKEELATHRNNLEKLVELRTEELEVAKLRAEESDKLKSSFLANVSHEIRTPLNAIVGFSSLLNDPDLEPWHREYFTQMIDSSSQMLLVLIDDILDLSKIEAHQISLKLTYFDLKELLNELKETHCKQNTNADINIYVSENNQNGTKLIRSDRIRLWQILNNFVSNALKFTKSGYIEIGYHFNQKQELTIYVKDTGIGINKEHHDIIFERFRKIENGSQKFHRGTGLGLAISKRLAELLGGSVELESEPEKGSTFYFIFKDKSFQ